MPEETIHGEKVEERAKIEAKVRQEVMRLFIEEAKLEAKAKEQRKRLLEEREEELKEKAAKAKPSSKRKAEIIKIPPREEQLELDLEVLQARARLEEKIRREKKRGKRIMQGVVISCFIIALTIITVLNYPKGITAHYDLVGIKDCLQKSSSYYGQFRVEDVSLSGESPSATLSLGFSPSTDTDLKDFVETLVKRYSLARPGERLDLLLKKDQRVYAKVSYIPQANSIDIELMK